MKLAKRMLFNKKGSLIGAVLAVTIGILVIHVNFVIFQGLFDAMQVSQQTAYITEATKYAEIMALTTVADVNAYDVNASW